MKVKGNLSQRDRFARAAVGLIAVGLSASDYLEDALLDIIFIAMGLFLMVTAAFGICPVYGFLGINTKKNRRSVY